MTNPVLSKLESFGLLSLDDRTLISDVIATAQKIDDHTDIIREQDRPDVVHLLTEGFACRYKELMSGKRQIVAVLLPGDFCNLNADLFDAIDYSVATLAPSRIARISKETIQRLIGRPAIADAISKSALIDNSILHEWIANIGARKAEQRLAHLFCELHARAKAVGLVRSDGTAIVPMTQVELGEALGLSIVHTNRSLKQLKEQGLMTHKSGVLTIPDAKALESFCGFNSNYLHIH